MKRCSWTARSARSSGAQPRRARRRAVHDVDRAGARRPAQRRDEHAGAGDDLREVMEWLGHSQISVTSIYTHIPAEAMQERPASLAGCTYCNQIVQPRRRNDLARWCVCAGGRAGLEPRRGIMIPCRPCTVVKLPAQGYVALQCRALHGYALQPDCNHDSVAASDLVGQPAHGATVAGDGSTSCRVAGSSAPATRTIGSCWVGRASPLPADGRERGAVWVGTAAITAESR